jgi:Lipoprotein LpqB beta-propeller domain/WD40-like Beta Propeller Repeat
MSKVDDELSRRLQRAERPVEGGVLFEGLRQRRTHREHVRKAQASALAFAVLVGTVGGFVALRSAFLGDGRTTGDPGAPLASSGEIVFSRRGDDDRFHLFAARPDGSGVRQITDDATNDTDPAVSPDGTTIAFVHELDQDIRVIGTVPIDGGTVTWLTDEELDAHDPAWSPDGDHLAFVGASQFHGFPVEDSVVFVTRPGQTPHALLHNNAIDFADPSWSPDGSVLAVAARDQVVGNDVADHWMIVEIGLDDPPQPRLGLTDVDERAPAWSPDGTLLAFVRAGADGNEVWTRSREDGSETLIAAAVEASLDPDLAWAPDGTTLLVSDGDWIYRVDATPDSDPRDNFVQLLRGFAPSWQPLPTGQPVAPDPDGMDIGLGVRMCDLEVLHGINWDGTGIDGAAWTGAPVDEDGRCSSSAGVQHVVAVDRNGDGIAEQGSTSTLRSCLLCRPFDTVDLNDDGVLELVVLEEASSTPTYSIFEVNRPGSERADGVYPIIVVAPGAPAMNLDANGAVRFTVGGDEGFSGSMECENAGGGAPILRYTWVRGAVDADTELRVDIARLSFGEDGVFHIESADRFNVPRNPEPTDLKSTEPACGVDFHPAA